AGECLRQQQTLLLTARETTDRPIRVRQRLHRCDRLLHPLMVAGRIAQREAPSVAVDAEVNEITAPHGQVPVDVAALGGVADPRVAAKRTLAEDTEAAGRGRLKPE